MSATSETPTPAGIPEILETPVTEETLTGVGKAARAETLAIAENPEKKQQQ
jgi:hypothetical protein